MTNELINSLDEYTSLERGLSLPGVSIQRQRAELVRNIFALSASAIDSIIAKNERLHRTIHFGVRFEIIIDLYTSFEAMQKNGVIDPVVVERISAIRECIAKLSDDQVIGRALQRKAKRDKIEGRDPAAFWKGNAHRTPSHSSKTNSAAEEGWKVGGYIDTGPPLMRGTIRPGRTGGVDENA